MNIVQDKFNIKIELKAEIGKGGEGVVYQVDNTTVAKIYKKDQLTQMKEDKIKALAAKKLSYDGICLPSIELYDLNKNFIGYTMPKADGFEMQTSIFNPKLIKIKFPNWGRLELAKMAITILKKIDYLHSNNVLIGDINPFNILVKDFNEVYFVDTDSYQVDNFPCPVGTIHFTAPEIQGKDYKTFLRNEEHEYFAIATLLFMILLPGKSPYSFQGGGDITENIKTNNFSYPLGDEDNFLAPQGMWEFIWTELPFDVRKAFHLVFKDNERLSPRDWIGVMESFISELEMGDVPNEIIPTDTEKILSGRTVNMNRRDIKAKDEHLRISKTELRTGLRDGQIGVLELSTKAVKLLIGDKRQVQENGFDFRYFYRTAMKTETGSGLDKENIMDMYFFRSRVIPAIQKMVRIADDKRVSELYTVSTAAYRTAKNRDEVISTIKEECGINVKILSKKEEALATLTAFMFSRPSYIKIDKDENIIMVDQGGGSTEISLFRGDGELIDSYSLNLGTTVLKTILFKEATANTLLDKALKDSEKLIKDRLKTFYASPKSKLLIRKKSNFCVSVGTAITNATNKRGNPKQHGTKLTLENLKNKVEQIDELLKLRYSSVLALLRDMESGDRNRKSDSIDNMVVMRLGLPMFIEIMEKFHIDSVVVSGTGLWYGVYFENLFNLNNN